MADHIELKIGSSLEIAKRLAATYSRQIGRERHSRPRAPWLLLDSDGWAEGKAHPPRTTLCCHRIPVRTGLVSP
jgi:hypothetical protein